MDKRYQVFISSTYEDLKRERRAAIEAIVDLGCFPAGMESFPASSQSQFEYITRVIDKSDYYILILAGKYGSLYDKSISYTEKEYNYAKEKGIPILAFVKKDIENLPESKKEISLKKRKMLESFKDSILNNKLVGMWNNAEELKRLIIQSLNKEFNDNPRTGWIRAGESDKYVSPIVYFTSEEPVNASVGDIWIGDKLIIDGGDEG